ncbi:DUF3566 domain-containing protein [Candidatus Woesearchaeota archaeon]|nr:DUF3566 domain-containing protein [Candidatus Woesearchaeota archaeon]
MAKIIKFDPLSAGRLGIVYGFFVGFIHGFANLFVSYFTSFGMLRPLFWPFHGFGLWSVILTPIAFAVDGFIMGVVAAFLYNVSSGLVGGIRVRLK